MGRRSEGEGILYIVYVYIYPNKKTGASIPAFRPPRPKELRVQLPTYPTLCKTHILEGNLAFTR